MGRRRKVAIVHGEEEKENGSQNSHGPMYAIISKAQLNDSFHKKQLKELKQLYQQMDHAAFSFTFIKMIKAAMEAEECNEYADTVLNFCAKFVSAFNGDTPSPMFTDVLDWLLNTSSMDAHIRYRLCEFVNKILNALGQDASLDDKLCDDILTYMMDRLTDMSPTVRVQAIQALQRLQVPDDPEDPVLKAYQFHLAIDPSPRVRITVITCMGRNYHTIPYILERLWDIDEKVRRHTYLEISSYPVRTYKVAQRLILLEQGLNDRADAVRKVVISVMLHQWLESYQNDMVALVAALKLDSNEEEISRFRKISKQTLMEIFKRKDRVELVAQLPIEDDGEYHHCVPHEKLTIEVALLWQCMSEYFQNELAEELDSIQPELSTFCSYVEQFCLSKKSNMDKFEDMEFQYILLSLMEILYLYDLGDEIGRENLQKLLTNLLNKYSLDDNIIRIIVRCTENLISNNNQRMQYFVDIIQDLSDSNAKNKILLHDRALVDKLLAKAENPDLKIKLSTLKVKILELQEQQENHEKQANYDLAQQISDEREGATNDYVNLLRPLMEQCETGESVEKSLMKVVKPETILKCLQIAFHMVVSDKMTSLNPNLCQLYKDFICRHFASNQIIIRNWALKCGAAYSMLYQPLAKGVFVELYRQFMRLTNSTVWETAITCTFELIARYGLDNLVSPNNKGKKTGRLLYHTLDSLDIDDESNGSSEEENFDILAIMSHFLDKCDEVAIKRTIVKGFCRLILYGDVKSTDIVERLILRYFDDSTDSEMNQMLGIFLDNLIKRKKFGLLQLSLLPTIHKILNSSSDNPLREIKPKTITGFFIEATRGEACPNSGTIHNGLALMFLKELCEASNNKELCKLLVSELRTLDVSVDKHQQLLMEFKTLIEQLKQGEYDPKVIAGLNDFKDIIEGKRTAREAKNSNENDSEDEDEENTLVASSATTVASITPENASQQSTIVNDNVNDTSKIDEMDRESLKSNTTTTYGRDNSTRRNNLRKSFNLATDRRDSSDSASNRRDDVSRPAKIRIEARIDTETSPQKRQPLSESTTQEHPNEPNNEDDTLVDNTTPPAEARSPKRKSPPKNATNKLAKTPLRSSARTRNQTNRSELNDELNSSDIVPASPSATSKSTMRLRKDNVSTITDTATKTTEKRITRRAAQAQSPKTSSDNDESSSSRDTHKSPKKKKTKTILRRTPLKSPVNGLTKSAHNKSMEIEKSSAHESKATNKRNSQERSPKNRSKPATVVRNTHDNMEHEQSSSTDGAVSPPSKKTRNGLLKTKKKPLKSKATGSTHDKDGQKTPVGDTMKTQNSQELGERLSRSHRRHSIDNSTDGNRWLSLRSGTAEKRTLSAGRKTRLRVMLKRH